MIYNSYVLEHIDGADGVQAKFSNWLKPGGILILRIPDRDSVRGFVARLTPFWFHVFYVKYIVGLRQAGTTGFGPFRTFYDPIVSQGGYPRVLSKAPLRHQSGIWTWILP